MTTQVLLKTERQFCQKCDAVEKLLAIKIIATQLKYKACLASLIGNEMLSVASTESLSDWWTKFKAWMQDMWNRLLLFFMEVAEPTTKIIGKITILLSRIPPSHRTTPPLDILAIHKTIDQIVRLGKENFNKLLAMLVSSVRLSTSTTGGSADLLDQIAARSNNKEQYILQDAIEKLSLLIRPDADTALNSPPESDDTRSIGENIIRILRQSKDLVKICNELSKHVKTAVKTANINDTTDPRVTKAVIVSCRNITTTASRCTRRVILAARKCAQWYINLAIHVIKTES